MLSEVGSSVSGMSYSPVAERESAEPCGDLSMSAISGTQEWIATASLAETSWPMVRALEELKQTIVARQAELTVALHEEQTSADAARGFNPAHTDRLVAAQLGLARRRSPLQAWRLLRIAHLAVASDPVREAMTAGHLGEDQAGVISREVDGLTGVDRAAVIDEVAESFGTTSDRHLADRVRAVANRVDPELAGRRAEAARGRRRVSLRNAPDGMAHLSALLPAANGRACLEALRTGANLAKRAEQDQAAPPNEEAAAPRTANQWMADLLIERLTGKDPVREPVDVQVNLLVPIDALISDRQPGYLSGYGPVPAPQVRDLIEAGDRDAAEGGSSGVKVRRLFVHPLTGDLLGMDAKTRRFRGLLADFVRLRDQRCRTPFCGAAITDIDHIQPHSAGGATSASNAQGECSPCNQVKEHADWETTGTAHMTTVQTAGLTAATRPPPLPGSPPLSDSWAERYLGVLEWRWALHRAAPDRPPDDEQRDATPKDADDDDGP